MKEDGTLINNGITKLDRSMRRKRLIRVGRNLIIRSEREGKGREVGDEDVQKTRLGSTIA